MKNNKFIKSTMILVLGGFVTKLLGFIIKILYTRRIGSLGISLYTLVMPLYSLIVCISSFGMPAALSKLVSENKIRSKRILAQGVYILLFINIVIMVLVILCSSFIANYLLNESRVRIIIICLVIAMPNMGLACVLKGYFYGKQKMLPNSISNILEQLIRIVFVIFILPSLVKKSVILGICSFVLINVITEGVSILTFMFLLPKNTVIRLSDIKYEKDISKEVIRTTTPLISNKIIGNIGYFLEPIILSNILVRIGYDSNFFTLEYGIYNAYSLGLLLMPSFLIIALCTAIIPEVSKLNSMGNKMMIKRRIKQISIICLVVGCLSTLLIVIFRDSLLKLIYNTNLGSQYILYLGSFFSLYYLEAPLGAVLQSLNNGTYLLKVSIMAIIAKNVIMGIISLFHVGIMGLIIGEACSILLTVVMDIRRIRSIVR